MILQSPITEQRQAFTGSLFGALFPSLVLVLVVAAASGIRPGAPAILVFLVAGVVVLGLPHGALDPLVAAQIWGARPHFTMMRFGVVYLAVAALCAAVWISLPTAALVGFLSISAYHFGSDWNGRCSAWGQSAFGIAIVTVPTLCKGGQVEEIYRQLGASSVHQLVSVSQFFAVVAVAGALFAALVQSKFQKSNLVELLTVVVGGLFLPPLLFFTCYFCLLHSPRHLMQTARTLGLRGLQEIVRSAAPTVFATLLLAAGLWRFLPSSVYSEKLIQLVFIGLAALTAPHMLLTEFSLRRSFLPLSVSSGTHAH